MNELRELVLEKLREREYYSVPELGAALGVGVSPELIAVLTTLKHEKLIRWKIGQSIRLTTSGFEQILAKAS